MVSDKNKARVRRLIRRGCGVRAATAAVVALRGGHDTLTHREPFAAVWSRETGRAYSRPELLEEAKESLRSYATNRYWHYGPGWRGWPGTPEFCGRWS